MSEADIDARCDKAGPWAGKVLQNRKKLAAIVHNARQCVQIEDRHPGGLSAFLWSVVALEGQPSTHDDDIVEIDGLANGRLSVNPRCVNGSADCSSPEYQQVFGVTSEFSDTLAAVLKKKKSGDARCALFDAPFQFLGSVTLQAFMLQCGLLNGHSCECARSPRYQRACGPPTPGKRRAAPQQDSDADLTPATKRSKRQREDMRTPASCSTDDVWL